MDLSKETILVRLRIRMAGISSRSRTLSQEAADKHEADSDSVRGIVQKLSSTDLAPIIKIVNEARFFFLANTLPWDDSGHRLVPVTRLSHIQRELDRMKSNFMDEVDTLVSRHSQLHREYKKRVNDLAQEIAFPTQQELESNFDFEVIIQPIANPNDLRLKGVDPKSVEEIKDSVGKQYAVRIDEAMQDIVNRLYEKVARVHEQTGKEDGRLFKSLITNIEEAVDVLPKLNIKNDPEINRLVTRVRTEMTSLDVEAMRADPKLRKQTSKLAADILGDLKSFGKPVKKVAAKPAETKPVKAAAAPTNGKKANRFANVAV